MLSAIMLSVVALGKGLKLAVEALVDTWQKPIFRIEIELEQLIGNCDSFVKQTISVINETK
jgi:hypothetical protein